MYQQDGVICFFVVFLKTDFQEVREQTRADLQNLF